MYKPVYSMTPQASAAAAASRTRRAPRLIHRTSAKSATASRTAARMQPLSRKVPAEMTEAVGHTNSRMNRSGRPRSSSKQRDPRTSRTSPAANRRARRAVKARVCSAVRVRVRPNSDHMAATSTTAAPQPPRNR